MPALRLSGHVNESGLLTAHLPASNEFAGQEFEVLVSLPVTKPTPQEWQAWLDATAGSIPDETFFRHPI
jgi:hypothetical protein